MWQEIYDILFNFFNNDIVINVIDFINQFLNGLFSLFRENQILEINLSHLISIMTLSYVIFVFILILILFKKIYLGIVNVMQGKEYNVDEDIIRIKKRRK